MALDASQALSSPQLAAVKVCHPGSAWRQASRQSYSPLAMLVAPLAARIMLGPRPATNPAQTPPFSQVALLAVTKDELVLVRLASRNGLTFAPAGALARVPLDQVAAIDLGRARIVWPLTITFRDGSTWRLEIPGFSKKAAKTVATLVSGQLQQV